MQKYFSLFNKFRLSAYSGSVKHFLKTHEFHNKQRLPVSLKKSLNRARIYYLQKGHAASDFMSDYAVICHFNIPAGFEQAFNFKCIIPDEVEQSFVFYIASRKEQ